MARGYLTLAAIGAFLLVSDPLERLFIGPLITWFPRSREPVLAFWMRAMAGGILLIVGAFAGARVDRRTSLPGRDGVLVISNHQSLLDIPVAVWSFSGKHPRIVTRARFARGIPVVSHLLRITKSPLVDPGSPSAPQLEELRRVAETCTNPLLIYPEGHRSRDGELLTWRRGGLRAILAARPWTVHLLVVDGLFRAGKFKDLVRALPGLRATAVSVGPFEWTDPEADPKTFLDELERRMGAALAASRREGDVDASPGRAGR